MSADSLYVERFGARVSRYLIIINNSLLGPYYLSDLSKATYSYILVVVEYSGAIVVTAHSGTFILTVIICSCTLMLALSF